MTMIDIIDRHYETHKMLSVFTVFVLLIALTMGTSNAAADSQAVNLDNGLWMIIPDGWKENNNWWTDDTEMFQVLSSDLSGKIDSKSISDIDVRQRTVKTLLMESIDSTEYYSDVALPYGWVGAVASFKLDKYHYNMLMILTDKALCGILHANITGMSFPPVEKTIEIARWINNEKPQGYEVYSVKGKEINNYKTEEGYSLSKVPLIVNISEEDYNIVYLGMSNDSVSLRRSGYNFDSINQLLNYGEKTEMIIWNIGEEGFGDKSTSIHIRVKEDKYEGTDFRKISKHDIDYMFDLMLTPYTKAEVNYSTETINGIPYGVYCMQRNNSYDIRYATILKGCMVYIYMVTPVEPSSKEMDMLHNIIENIYVGE